MDYYNLPPLMGVIICDMLFLLNGILLTKILNLSSNIVNKSSHMDPQEYNHAE